MSPDAPVTVTVNSQGDASQHTGSGDSSQHSERTTTTTTTGMTSPMIKALVGGLLMLGIGGGGVAAGRWSGGESSDQAVRIQYLEKSAEACKERLKALEDERIEMARFVASTDGKITALQASVNRIETMLSTAAALQRRGVR